MFVFIKKDKSDELKNIENDYFYNMGEGWKRFENKFMQQKEADKEYQKEKNKNNLFQILENAGFDFKTYFEEKEKKKIENDKKYDFPITLSQAIDIANRDENLKTDYCRNTDREGAITYLKFNNMKERIIEKDNKKYFELYVTEGDISGIDGDTMWDGELYEDDFKILKCLIDVETGEYRYNPY